MTEEQAKKHFDNCCMGNIDWMFLPQYDDDYLVVEGKCPNCGKFYQECWQVSHIRDEEMNPVCIML